MEPSLQAVNEYEARRAARIAQNKQRMAALGVVEAAQQLQKQQQQKKQHRWRQPTNKPRPAAVSEPIATRASKRIRGHPASEAATQVDNSNDQASTECEPSSRSALPNTKKVKAQPDGGPRFELTSTVYGAPFTLPSIGVTVWELGQIYRGPFSSNYYSSRGCLYRHAYPVGYRASKEVFGYMWDMTITAGEGGPVFTVSQQGGGRSFSGPSPTRPWTDVCLAFRTGQRISGPLYFGFSDVHVQRALAALYTPAELAYALYGTPLSAPQLTAPLPQQQQPQQPEGAAPAAAVSPDAAASSGNSSADSSTSHHQDLGAQATEEQQQLLAAEAFAADLRRIKGIGAATAQVLALTTALGGVRHRSLKALCSWLAAEPQHRQQLQHYLLNSEEVPRCSRQLPSWREKWVPLIMQQLADEQALHA